MAQAKAPHNFLQLLVEPWACRVRTVARWLHVGEMVVRSASVLLRCLQGGRIGDPLAALVTGNSSADEMRWTDQPLVHSGGRLHGDKLLHEGFVNAATQLAERLRQHKGGLGGMDLILTNLIRTELLRDNGRANPPPVSVLVTICPDASLTRITLQSCSKRLAIP